MSRQNPRRGRIKNPVLGIISAVLILSMTFISLVSCESTPDTTGTGIIVGENGWLFDENGGELGDYNGERLFSEEELDAILATVKSKRTFFAKTNTDLIIVFIPDKMNVYSDMLPADIQSTRASETRLSQVYNYVKKNTRVTVVDMTELYSMNSAAFDIYERTDSMISDMGAYLCYTEIVKAVNSLNIADLDLAQFDEFSTEIADDEGLSFAKRISAESKYKNKTISLTYKNALPYINEETDIDNLTATSIPEENRDENFRYTNLMLYGTEGTLEPLEQFCSLTFKSVGYAHGFNTDALATTTLKPNQAVFVVNERELDRLMTNEALNTDLFETAQPSGGSSDPDPIASSLELIPPDENTCAAPIVTGKCFSQSNRLAVAGVAENGTTITVNGADEEYSYYVYDGIFLLDIPFDHSSGELEIYASADGKNDSARVKVTVTSSMPRGGKGCYVGRDGHLHIDATMSDYLGTNAYSTGSLNSKKKKLERKLETIHDASPDTKLIIMIAPNHSTIYPESVPDWVEEQYKEGSTSKLQQLYGAMANTDIIFVNLTDLLISKKSDDYLLYQKTDTHWNELGAYYAYEYLMNEFIAPDFPAAAATPLSEFEIFTKSIPGGDLLNFFGFNLDLARENAIFVRPLNYTPITGYDKPYRMNFENIWTSETHEFTVDNDELPTMVMYRDSFSSNLINLLAEKFSKSYFNSMWSYSVNVNIIKKYKPDYVIIEAVERNLEDIFS